MSEEAVGYGPKYKVAAWVRDQDLEGVLNDHVKQGWDIRDMFRNLPGADKLETTTIVFEEDRARY